jgi:hypothetical protein
MNKSALLLTSAVGLTFAAGGTAFALNKTLPHNGALKKINAQRLPGAPAKPARPGSSGAQLLKEQFVVHTASNSLETLISGFNLDSSTGGTFRCKSACTVITDTVAQFSSYYSYNQFAICPVVDGYFTDGACTYFTVPGGHGYVNVPFRSSASVSSGTHSAEVYLYTFEPAYLGARETDYHVYKDK